MENIKKIKEFIKNNKGISIFYGCFLLVMIGWVIFYCHSLSVMGRANEIAWIILLSIATVLIVWTIISIIKDLILNIKDAIGDGKR